MNQYFWQKHDLSNPFRSHTPRGYYDKVKGHTGGDWIMPEGEELSLPVETVVVQVLEQEQMGKTLYLKDAYGNILVFSHLSRIYVGQGDRVARDKVFALSGNTGTATTDPHLHFEVIAQEPQKGQEVMARSLGGFKGYNIEPLSYLDSLIHWSHNAMQWALQHEIITQEHSPDSPVSWGEYVVTMERLAKRILDWTKE